MRYIREHNRTLPEPSIIPDTIESPLERLQDSYCIQDMSVPDESVRASEIQVPQSRFEIEIPTRYMQNIVSTV
jgi:hypothetical protein